MRFQLNVLIVLWFIFFLATNSSIAQERFVEEPAIEFTYIPPYGSSDNLVGCVKNVNPQDYKIAVFIFVEGAGWWTKPYFSHPLTSIQSDSTWTCDITTGGSDIYATEICAFLIPNGIDPPLVSGNTALPEALYSISVVHICTIRTSREISFSGYEWWVKASAEPVGPGPNYFSDSQENVWVDEEGKLHLKIEERDGKWHCGEVILKESFTYGRYVFQITGTVGQLDPNVVLGLFTWDNSPEEHHREIDIEFSRWGVELADNAQYVIQPWDQHGNRYRWMMPELIERSTHSFEWGQNSIDFLSLRGHNSFAPEDSIIYTWHYSGTSIPTNGNEKVRINLWLFYGNAPTDMSEVEVVIDKVEYYPLTSVEELFEESSRSNPSSYSLYQNYPNPFNSSTEIRYQIPEDSYVSLKVFNTLGQEVRSLVDRNQKANRYTVLWDGLDDRSQEVASGLYFCRLKAGDFSKTRKMLMLK